MIRKAALLAMMTTTMLSSAVVVLPGTADARTTAAGAREAGVGAAGARPAAARQGRQEPQLVVESITPDVPRDPTTEIRISGFFANTGEARSGLRIRRRHSAQPFARRADLAAYLRGEGVQPLSYRDQYLEPTVAPSAKAPWEITVTPEQLGISRFGVYPLLLEVLDGFDQQIAVQRTVLTYLPKDVTVPRTKIAMVMPVIDQPRRADDATFVDDTLAKYMASGQRLGDLLKIAQDNTSAKGLTWMVDPALLDDAQAMAKTHTVKTKDTVVKRPASAEAGRWLRDLRAALARPPVIATPYADPDVTALAHNGVDDATRSGIEAAARIGRETLGRDVIDYVNWPVNGVVDYDGLDALADAGVDTVLLDQRNLPPAADQPSTVPPEVPATTGGTTPDAFARLESVDGPVTALVADPALSDVLGADTSTPGAAALNRQRFVAETAMIGAEQAAPATTATGTAETPKTAAKTVIAVPPRRWHPDPGYVTGLVKATATLPWLSPVTLDALKRPKSPATPRAGLTYTEQDRRAELGKPYMSSVKRVSSRADLTTGVTTAQDLDIFEPALLRLASSAWRGRTEDATPYVRQVAAAVDGRIAKVSISGSDQPQFRTLAGSDGNVPISVRNDLTGLGSEIAVQLRVTSDKPKLLEIDPYESEDSPIVIAGGQNRTIRVPMRATAIGGQTTVTVQLVTRDGHKYGKPAKLTVRTTGYTGIALFIVGAALAVMLAAVVMRVLRRRGARRGAASRASQAAPTAPPRPAGAPAGTES
ncbi:hypothetical protein AB0D67_11340 [Streptosporangium sp. NPDC048047]|uniref:hypothetical protein n=1 Tax=Streptosporangium sp. NPDC048047 TaxID=3155748 RepID=UPI003436FCC1